VGDLTNKFIKHALCNLKLRQPSKQGDIFIFTVPRSGLTWLLEIFSRHPHTRCIKEPFGLWNISKIQNYFEPRSRYCDLSEEDFERIRRYIEDILSNKQPWKSHRASDGKYKVKTSLNVFAFSKVCNFSHWFEQVFGCRILYLVRHPISNALSKLNNRWYEAAYKGYQNEGWRALIEVFLESRQFCESYLNSDLIKQSWRILKEGNDLERYILSWCLDNIVPIQYFRKRHWLLVSYEDLVWNSELTLQTITEHFGLGYLKKMKQNLNLPSKSSDMCDRETIEMIRRGDKKFLVSRWRKEISEKDIDRCFSILKYFDIDLYCRESDLLNPKYDIYKQAHHPDFLLSQQL
tara:strand:- start:109 stop:1152 length:1044 start_codon:yes stop_codon:yes gene_type:complete